MPEISTETDPIQNRCTPSIVPLHNEGWKDVIDEVIDLENLVFEDAAFPREEIEEQLQLPQSCLVLLKDPEAQNKTIGFSYATPLSYMYEEEGKSADDFDYDMKHIQDGEARIEREDKGAKTAYIMDTVIHPEYRGHHLVGKMIAALEQELVVNGYEFAERDAAELNNYAANIAKKYNQEGRLLYTGSAPHESQWGYQRFFRIKL